MSKSKKRNKTYRPKAVSKNPLSEIFGGMSGDHADHLRGLNITNHLALTDLAQGRGTKEGWNLMVGAMNMANVMCEQGIGPEFRDQFIAGRESLLECGKRFHRTGHFGFDGAGLQGINEAMDCHDAQLANVRAIDVERAYVEVRRRIKYGINSTSLAVEVARDQESVGAS